MAHPPPAFESQIFEQFRTHQTQLEAAKTLLKDNGYIVVEAKNKIEGQYI
jgi:hypothetical protein